MSLISIANFHLGPTTVLSNGMKNIIDAMKVHNVEIVSVCLSGKFCLIFLLITHIDNFHVLLINILFLAAFLFYKPEAVPNIFKDVNADHQRMFDLLKESKLKWIAILPPHFTSMSLFVILKKLLTYISQLQTIVCIYILSICRCTKIKICSKA